MSEHIITNANDVELILESGGTKRGTPRDMGRIVVDEFTITREEDDSLVSGVGFRLPAGVTYGDIEFGWSFTMIGEDTEVFDMVSTEDGRSRAFSFTARKTDSDDTLQWEIALDTCVTTSDEYSATSGDPSEVPLEGIATDYERITG